MAANYVYDEQIHAVRVTLTGQVTAQIIRSVFEELYLGKYPADINSLWNCDDCQFDVSVMEIFELARFTQSQREFDGVPATALVAEGGEIRDLCEEYCLLVREAPHDVEIFSTIEEAEHWLLQRRSGETMT